MPGKTATAKAPVAGEVDLLADIANDDTGTVQDPNEEFDLLSDMSGSDAVAWVPFDDDDVPDGIQGTVTFIGTIAQDAKYVAKGASGEVPYVEIQAKDGTLWGIRGYATVLHNQLKREIEGGLAAGDLLAVVYKGIKPNRSRTNDYKDFVVRSKKA